MSGEDNVVREVEGFLVVTSRVVFGDIEAFGVVPIGLDLGVAAPGETEEREDIFDFFDGLGDEMKVTYGWLVSWKSDVELELIFGQ
jgi:hypothetical protein